MFRTLSNIQDGGSYKTSERTIFTKKPILDVKQDSEVASEPNNNLREKLHLRRIAEPWIHLFINYFRKTCLFVY